MRRIKDISGENLKYKKNKIWIYGSEVIIIYRLYGINRNSLL